MEKTKIKINNNFRSTTEYLLGVVNGLKKSLSIFRTLNEDGKYAQTKEDLKSLQLLYAFILNEDLKDSKDRVARVRHIQGLLVKCNGFFSFSFFFLYLFIQYQEF